MKFSFFHLMPYPYLPDDFDERLRLVGARPTRTRTLDPSSAPPCTTGTWTSSSTRDKLGFDGIAVNEHHQTAYGLMPSPNLMAAALARRTTRARIMVLGNAIGIRGNPLRVAEEIAMLDLMSGGRVDSGFVRGIGWEYFGHSINPTKSRSRFNEAHDLIIKAWTSPEMFSWYGENYEYRYVNLWPRPLQQPHPPIYIPGAGSTETMKFCAEREYTYMSVYAPTRIVRRWFDGYRAGGGRPRLRARPGEDRLLGPDLRRRHRRAGARARPGRSWSGCTSKGLQADPGDGERRPGTCRPGRCAACWRRACGGFGGAPTRSCSPTGRRWSARPAAVAERLGELYDELGGFGQIIGLFAIGPSTTRAGEAQCRVVRDRGDASAPSARYSGRGHPMSELRDELLAGIRANREKFESAGDRAEELRTLPHDAVAILRSLGLFWLKTPAELGGTPLPPAEFCDVIEELAYVDTSTAWAAMIGAGCNGLTGGWLPEDGGAADLRHAPRTASARWSPGSSHRAAPGTRSRAATWSAAAGASPAASCTPTG